jgi:hypothetical protein
MRERPILFSGPMVRAILDGRKAQTRRVVKFSKPFTDHASWMACYPHPNGGWIFTDQPLPERVRDEWIAAMGAGRDGKLCPYGQPGDRLWVREMWQALEPEAIGAHKPCPSICPQPPICVMAYAAAEADRQREFGGVEFTGPWRPSIHMPRWASRLTLEITEVQVQRVQDISEEDARAEGMWSWELSAQDIADIQISDESPDVKKFWKAMGPGRMPARSEFRMLWDSINNKGGYGWDANPWVWAIAFRRINAA